MNDAENKLNDAQDKIDSGLAEIQNNEIKLQNSKNQIDQGWNEYYANLQLLDNIPTLQMRLLKLKRVSKNFLSYCLRKNKLKMV